jgi:hypothetical protein
MSYWLYIPRRDNAERVENFHEFAERPEVTHAAEYEDFLRRERLWERAQREKSIERYRTDLANLGGGFRSGLVIMGGTLALLWWLLR